MNFPPKLFSISPGPGGTFPLQPGISMPGSIMRDSEENCRNEGTVIYCVFCSIIHQSLNWNAASSRRGKSFRIRFFPVLKHRAVKGMSLRTNRRISMPGSIMRGRVENYRNEGTVIYCVFCSIFHQSLTGNAASSRRGKSFGIRFFPVLKHRAVKGMSFQDKSDILRGFSAPAHPFFSGLTNFLTLYL